MKKISVRERIITTASDLFYNQGFNQTGINQIIAEAGVAKASMYQYFRSKEDIAVEYLIGRHSIWVSNLNNFVSTQETSKDKVIACFDFLIKWLNEVEFRGCGWQNIITDLPKDHDKIRAQAVLHKNNIRALIHSLIKDEKKYGNDNEAEQLGDQIIILLEGAIILSQIQKNEWPIMAAKNACIKLLD